MGGHRDVPPRSETPMRTRREFLRGTLFAAGALAFGSSLLAACSSPAAAPTNAPAAARDKNYQIPKNLDQLKALCDQMKKDGIVPFASADKQGWPAMGTFDILNMRVNGYDFHVSLMAGKEPWTDPKVKSVFDTWKGLLPYLREGALGRNWQDVAQSLVIKQVGMFLLGSFVGQQFTNQADHDDPDFFPYPEIDPQEVGRPDAARGGGN
jgi:ABC-type glycerol-3-phosphate transport system substrate-binding protein